MYELPHPPIIKDKNRYDWIDCAKGIAIILVVYRHAAHGLIVANAPLAGWIRDLNDMLYSFRIPLFVMLSGVFFGKSLAKYGARQLLTNKVNTLLYPYILWALIQITLQILFSNYTNSQRTISDYADIIMQPRAIDQLWYLLLLFNVTALYLGISLLLKTKQTWHLVIGLALLGIVPLIQHFSLFSDIALHYIFFAIGQTGASFMQDKEVQRKMSNGNWLLLLLPVFAAVQYYFLKHQHMNLYLYMLVAVQGSIYVIMLSLFLVKHNFLGFLKTIGSYSLYVYLLHVTISFSLRNLLMRTGWFTTTFSTSILLVVLIAASIFLSILAYRLLERINMGFLFKGSLGEHKIVKQDERSTQPGKRSQMHVL